jgi:F420-dependent oxidoreductase-like protein
VTALRIFTEPQQGATYDDLLAVARETERLGFDGFFRSDHLMAMAGSGEPGPTDAWTTLAGLARDTSRIRLGTLMTAATFRLPGPLAIAVAQVDAMSGGRVELGIGTGWFEQEHAAYGIPFPSLNERFERLAEQLAIITGLWTTPTGERFSWEGTHYRLTDSPALPKPAQSPRPPVIVGGWGRTRTPRLAARYADEFNVPFSPLSAFDGQVAAVRAACETVDRDPATMRFSAALTTAVGADEAEYARRAAAAGQSPDQVRANGAGGTVGEVVERLRGFADAGAETIYLQVMDLADFDHLGLIAAEVAPALA